MLINPAREIIDYGVQLTGAPLIWKETMGEGIRVGVIDTGADVSHPDLKERIEEYINFTGDGTLADGSGHGTHVCGIIAASYNGIGIVGVAPKCELYVAKAFKKDGSAESVAIADSIEWLISKKVNVINMSFASDKPSAIIYEKIKKAYDQGIVLVAASGNEGTEGSVGYPAKWDEVIAVTAIDPNKKFASFNSYGNETCLAAAGRDIYSTYPGGKYKKLSGTSMAAPMISGVAALMQGKAKRRFSRLLTPHEIKLLLYMYADDYGESGKDNKFGYGVFSFDRIKK